MPLSRPGFRRPQPTPGPAALPPPPDDISRIVDAPAPAPIEPTPEPPLSPGQKLSVRQERMREVEYMKRDRTIEILVASGDPLWERLRSHLLQDLAERGGSLWETVRREWCEVPF